MKETSSILCIHFWAFMGIALIASCICSHCSSQLKILNTTTYASAFINTQVYSSTMGNGAKWTNAEGFSAGKSLKEWFHVHSGRQIEWNEQTECLILYPSKWQTALFSVTAFKLSENLFVTRKESWCILCTLLAVIVSVLDANGKF